MRGGTTDRRRTCLIVTFLRVENFQNLLNKCKHANIERVYIAIDGPRNQNEYNIQSQYDQILLQYREFFDVKIWRRQNNLGIGLSIVTAIDWYFRNEDYGIILEDDLEISDSFFDFMFDGLSYFEQDRRISMISGDRFFSPMPYSENISFTNYPQTWGWGTWKIEWKSMRQIYEVIPKFSPHSPFKVYSFWLLGYLRVLSRKVDTWDIPLGYYMLKNNMYSVLPPKNLVSNVGFDLYSSHTTTNEFPLNIPRFEIPNYNFSNSISIQETSFYNVRLEKFVFKIKFLHNISYTKFIVQSFLRNLFHSKSNDFYAFKSSLDKITIPD